MSPYRDNRPREGTRRLKLGIIARLAHTLGATYRWHVVDHTVDPPRRIGTDQSRTALLAVRDALREHEGDPRTDVRLLDYLGRWEYQLSVETCAYLLLNECRVCGARFKEPCDATLHS